MKFFFLLFPTVFLFSCVTRQLAVPVEPLPDSREMIVAEEEAGREREEETSDTPGEQAEISEEASPPDVLNEEILPPLLFSEIEDFIRSNALEGYYPVQREGSLLRTTYDLYGNGLEDYFVLFVEAESPEAAEVSVLGDMENLYSPDSLPPAYYLQAFLQEPGRVFEGKRVSLGKLHVFSSLFQLRVSIRRRRPFAVLAEFLTPDSIRTEWVIYSDSGISRFSTGKTLMVTPRIEDIDGDGFVDIVIQEKILEEGTGFETFLTWYRWSGEEYKEYKTTNVVRNLKTFLESCSTYIAARGWKEFCSFAVSRSDLSILRSQGCSYSQITNKVLSPFNEEDEEEPPKITVIPEIESIVFPQLMEDPFLRQTGRFLFPFFVKVISGGSNYLYHGTILLNDNPFSNPQFSFIPAD